MSFSSSVHYGPTTEALNDTFAEEITSLGGSVSDCYDDGERLFIRAVLPLSDDVARGDTIRAGIAMRTAGPAVFVHPYTMRQVCTNGAIMAHATQSVRIERVTHDGIILPSYDVAAILARVSIAIRACAEPEAFHQSTEDMRAAMLAPVDFGLQLLQTISHVSLDVARSLMSVVLAELAREENQTTFGVMNAITATARDTKDPEQRWYLEEAGATLIARVRRSSDIVTMSLAG